MPRNHVGHASRNETLDDVIVGGILVRGHEDEWQPLVVAPEKPACSYILGQDTVGQ